MVTISELIIKFRHISSIKSIKLKNKIGGTFSLRPDTPSSKVTKPTGASQIIVL